MAARRQLDRLGRQVFVRDQAQEVVHGVQPRTLLVVRLHDVPGRLLILADPKARGLVKPVGKISQDGFWLAFSKKHPDGKRLTDVFEKGMQHLHKSGQYKSMETAFLRKHNLDRGTPQ